MRTNIDDILDCSIVCITILLQSISCVNSINSGIFQVLERKKHYQWIVDKWSHFLLCKPIEIWVNFADFSLSNFKGFPFKITKEVIVDVLYNELFLILKVFIRIMIVIFKLRILHKILNLEQNFITLLVEFQFLRHFIFIVINTIYRVFCVQKRRKCEIQFIFRNGSIHAAQKSFYQLFVKLSFEKLSQ